MAAGFVIGEDRYAAPLPRRRYSAPLVALEASARTALLRPPCLVAFSGGRDSSAILAIATKVARRDGLPLPVPVTLVYPDVGEAHEDSWQDLVIEHLGLRDRHRLEIHDELGALGPWATRALRRHGLMWPPNAHMVFPLAEAARGGSLLTGIGGDSLFSAGSRLARVAGRKARPQARDLLRAALAASPMAVKRRHAAARHGMALPWLRPETDRRVQDAQTRWIAEASWRWDASFDWWWRSRDAQSCRVVLSVLAEPFDVQIVNPFFDPAFLAGFRDLGGVAGFDSRDEAMRRLFSDILPDALLSRRSKATFDGALWDERVAVFVREWDGSGVDVSAVDVDRLLAMWTSPAPDYRTLFLLQSAWLASADPGG